MLQLNQDLSIELLDAGPALADVASPPRHTGEPPGQGRETTALPLHHARGMCWYLAGGAACWSSPLLLVAFTFAGTHVVRQLI